MSAYASAEDLPLVPVMRRLRRSESPLDVHVKSVTQYATHDHPFDDGLQDDAMTSTRASRSITVRTFETRVIFRVPTRLQRAR